GEDQAEAERLVVKADVAPELVDRRRDRDGGKRRDREDDWYERVVHREAQPRQRVGRERADRQRDDGGRQTEHRTVEQRPGEVAVPGDRAVVVTESVRR